MLLHAGLDTAIRTDIIDKFDGRTELEEGEVRPRVIVCTTEIGGKGFTCVRAKHVFLMEPDFKESVERQAYFRVRRYGQQSPIVYSCRAYCPDIDIENTIVKRQELMAWVEQQTMEARARLDAEKEEAREMNSVAVRKRNDDPPMFEDA